MGPNTNRGSDSDGSFLGRIADALENRLIMLVVAGVIGTSGGVALVKTDPAARADPYTGAMGRTLERRVRKLEQSQALDDVHRESSPSGYARIRKLEQAFTECRTRLYSIEQQLKESRK